MTEKSKAEALGVDREVENADSAFSNQQQEPEPTQPHSRQWVSLTNGTGAIMLSPSSTSSRGEKWRKEIEQNGSDGHWTGAIERSGGCQW